MNDIFFVVRHKAAILTALVLLAASFQATAQDSSKTEEVQQYKRIPNKLKPGSSTLSIDLPFTFEEQFIDEEIPADQKNWFKASKRGQANRDPVLLVVSYALYTQEYISKYITGNEDTALRAYLQGGMINRMNMLEKEGEISAFNYRVMDIKLSDSKDKALLMKAKYREGSQDFEVWLLQILHKKEIWQLTFFFDPKNIAMQDAVEAACFSAVIK